MCLTNCVWVCAEHGPPRHRSCHPSAWSQGSQCFRQAVRSRRDSLVPCSQTLTVCCAAVPAMAAVVVLACVCWCTRFSCSRSAKTPFFRGCGPAHALSVWPMDLTRCIATTLQSSSYSKQSFNTKQTCFFRLVFSDSVRCCCGLLASCPLSFSSFLLLLVAKVKARSWPLASTMPRVV